jgi:hypothetical protein
MQTKQTPSPLSLHSVSPRLRTGEPLHLVCFWPSPTSMARREHHLCPPGVRWWVRSVRFCEWKGCIIFVAKQTPSPLAPRLRTGEPLHLVCFWPSPTSMARRKHHLGPPGVRWWVRSVRFCEWKGCIHSFDANKANTLPIITPSPHRRTNAPSLLLAFAHIHGEAETPSLSTRSAVVGPNGPVL